MSKAQEKGDRYQNKAEQLYKRLSTPETQVLPKVEIKGRITNDSREVDLQVISPEEFDFLAIECKNWKVTVGDHEIEAFISKLEDLGTKRGAIISNSNYTQGAVKWADHKNIQLFHLIDSADEEVKFSVSQKTLLVDYFVEGIELDAHANGGDFSGMPLDQIMLIHNTGEERISCLELFKEPWNSSLLPHLKGTHTVTIESPTEFQIVDKDGKLFTPDRLAFNYEVKTRACEGAVQLEEVVGIYDVRNKTLRSANVTTGPIKPIQAIQNWREIDTYNPSDYAQVLGMVSSIALEEKEIELFPPGRGIIKMDTEIKLRLHSEDGYFVLKNIEKE